MNADVSPKPLGSGASDVVVEAEYVEFADVAAGRLAWHAQLIAIGARMA